MRTDPTNADRTVNIIVREFDKSDQTVAEFSRRFAKVYCADEAKVKFLLEDALIARGTFRVSAEDIPNTFPEGWL